MGTDCWETNITGSDEQKEENRGFRSLRSLTQAASLQKILLKTGLSKAAQDRYLALWMIDC